MATKRTVTPLIYIGNKTDLLDTIATNLPVAVNERRWVVPFCGSMAPVLHFRPERAILTDNCGELMHFWEQLRDRPKRLLKLAAAALQSRGSLEASYYAARDRIRKLTADDERGPERAALFLIINRFGWRGLWRVNRSGECNVPFSKPREKNGKLPETNLVLDVSKYLRKPGIELAAEGYIETLTRSDLVPAEDFGYADPPYHGTTYSYQGMSADAFDTVDHIRLAQMLHKSGMPYMAHNKPTKLTRQAYRHAQQIEFGVARKVRNGKTLHRGCSELLATSRGYASF